MREPTLSVGGQRSVAVNVKDFALSFLRVIVLVGKRFLL